MTQEITQQAQTLHDQSIIIDGHCDTVLAIQRGTLDFKNGFTPPEDPCEAKNTISHIDLPRLKAGGTTTQVFASFAEKQYLPADATNQALRLFDLLYQAFEENEDFVMVRSASEIRAAKQAGKVGGLISIEGAESLEGELAILRNFHRLGLRQVGLTWNWRNQAADGLGEARSGGGLTEFGVALVKEANRLGIILDIAHLAPAGVKDILALSEQPIVDSHCGAKGLTDHVRNLDDAQLDALAKNGGVACVTFVPPFINGEIKSYTDSGKASIEDVFNHIDYIAKRIGVDHVGIGSDFDGFGGYLKGIEDVSKMPALTQGLLDRGYKPDEVSKIMGGNYLRVIEQVCG
jgi:membrane dipeptidase